MSKNKVFFILSGLFIMSAILLMHFGCKHDPDITNVCFESQILPIFQNNCTKSGCHNATDARRHIILTNYDDILAAGITKGNAKKSRVYQAINGSGRNMPPSGKLSGSQLALIYSWIQTGAENTTGCGPTVPVTCDTANVKYSTAISFIISARCFGSNCHEAGAANDFSTYTLFHDNIVGNEQTLLNNINWVSGADSMPKSPYPKLDFCAIRQITIWVKDSMPNN